MLISAFVFEREQDRKTGATNPHLILLNFTFTARPAKAISDFTAPLIQNASEPQLLSDVSSSYLVKG